MTPTQMEYDQHVLEWRCNRRDWLANSYIISWQDWLAWVY